MSLMRPQKFKVMGVINYNGKRWTYYDEKVLPGGGLNIPGRHTSDNLVQDQKGYVCLASSEYAKGTVLTTPILKSNNTQYKGKVYDYCGTSGTVDVYVNF